MRVRTPIAPRHTRLASRRRRQRPSRWASASARTSTTMWTSCGGSRLHGVCRSLCPRQGGPLGLSTCPFRLFRPLWTGLAAAAGTKEAPPVAAARVSQCLTSFFFPDRSPPRTTRNTRQGRRERLAHPRAARRRPVAARRHWDPRPAPLGPRSSSGRAARQAGLGRSKGCWKCQDIACLLLQQIKALEDGLMSLGTGRAVELRRTAEALHDKPLREIAAVRSPVLCCAAALDAWPGVLERHKTSSSSFVSRGAGGGGAGGPGEPGVPAVSADRRGAQEEGRSRWRGRSGGACRGWPRG